MKYLAAYCLAVLSGKEHPAANDVSTILKSVGIEPQDDQINKVIEALKGKNLHEVVSHGLTKVSGMSLGGGSSGHQDKKASASPKKDAKKAPSPKKEAKKEEEKPVEEDVDMGGLFDF